MDHENIIKKVDKDLDKSSLFYKIWNRYEKEKLLPEYINKVLEIDYNKFKKELDENYNNEVYIEGLVSSLFSGNIYIIKNVFSLEYSKLIRRELSKTFLTEKSTFHKINVGTPNFFRHIKSENNQKYSIKMVKQTKYYFPWNPDDVEIYKTIYPCWRLIKMISGYYPDAWEKNTPKDGIVDRIQIVRYPPKYGMIELHQDPYLYQKFFISGYFTKKGVDYNGGGMHAINKKNEKIDLEEKIDIGDVSFGIATIKHIIDPCDEVDNSHDYEKTGRWFLGLYSIEADYNKNRHTSKPAKLN